MGKTISNNKKVILTILFVVSFLILAYLYQLRQDLNAKKEVLKEMKEEQIDYSKEDARFKDVEEDSDSEELQNIE